MSKDPRLIDMTFSLGYAMVRQYEDGTWDGTLEKPITTDETNSPLIALQDLRNNLLQALADCDALLNDPRAVASLTDA